MNRSLSILPLVAILAACVAGAEAPPEAPLATPAAPGSGEPFLSSGEDGVYMSWLEPTEGEMWALKLALLDGEGWSEPQTIVERDDFFVNWADFPSVTEGPDGKLWAHWLQREGSGTYAYGVRIAYSDDGGATWSEPWTPHEDGVEAEHGFVSALALDGGMGFSWLDGRKFVEGPNGEPATREMTVRWRTVGPDGVPGPETLLDGRACDCCQTGSALTEAGPVVVYRNRTEEEIRDIYITRRVDGEWTDGVPVHDDGWNIGGCPVNGPSVGVSGDHLAVVWFTAAGDVPHVKVAFSSDHGASFGEPFIVDGGNPAGRVDLQPMDDGSFFVTWLERTGGEEAEIRMRRYTAAGPAGEAITVTRAAGARASGFPRVAQTGDGSFLVAWTDASTQPLQVRVTRVGVPQ